MPKKYVKTGLGFAALLIVIILLLLQKNRPGAPKDSEREQLSESTLTNRGIEPNREATKGTLERIYNTEFTLYGKVLDAYSDIPIVGVHIEGRIDREHGFPPATTVVTATTDERGGFSFQDQRGASILVLTSKEGYEPMVDAQKPSIRRYSTLPLGRGAPTQNTSAKNPTTLYLRLSRREPSLRHIARRKYVNPENGELFRLDFVDGFGVEVAHTTNFDKSNPRNGWGWDASVNFTRGGVIDRKSNDDFVAPDGVYENSFLVKVTKTNDMKAWKASFRKTCFFMTDSGKYGRIEFAVLGRNGDVIVELWHNDGSTRNTE